MKPGLTEDDYERIRLFASLPKVDRDPEMLRPDWQPPSAKGPRGVEAERPRGAEIHRPRGVEAQRQSRGSEVEPRPRRPEKGPRRPAVGRRSASIAALSRRRDVRVVAFCVLSMLLVLALL